MFITIGKCNYLAFLLVWWENFNKAVGFLFWHAYNKFNEERWVTKLSCSESCVNCEAINEFGEYGLGVFWNDDWCGFNFSDVYGDLGDKFIEIHHIIPLHSLNEAVFIGPKLDLIPLCSNCHRMIYRNKNNVLSVNELKLLISRKD